MALVVLLLLLAIAGLIYQSIASANDRREFPAPGRLVDVGGYRLHSYCIGQLRAGYPTVILEGGLASPVPLWHLIQSEVAAATRVCAYDRGGTGWSDPSPNPRDTSHIAAELHILLHQAGLRGPFVLVGHSAGGLYVRAVQRLYPEDVSGMVLIDATPEALANADAKARADYEGISRAFLVLPVLARLGVVRVAGICRRGIPANFPATEAAQYFALCAASPAWAVERDEHKLIPQPLPPGSRMAIPLAVLTAGENIKTLSYWGPLQDKLADLSSDSVHVVVQDASHSSFLIRAKDAHRAADMVMSVVNAVAMRKPLRRAHG